MIRLGILLVCVATAACAADGAQSTAPTIDASPNESIGAAPESVAPSAEPSASLTPAIALESGQVLRVMVNDLRMRDEPRTTAGVVDVLHAGETIAAIGGQPIVADGLTWYDVRQGPGPKAGWVTSGPERAWLSVVSNGRIAFYCTTCVPAPGGGSGGATFTIEPDGSDQQTLLDFAAVPTWSPDGTRIAVVLLEEEATRVVLIGVDGRDQDDLGLGAEPAWSADSSLLAYSDGTGRLILLDADGSPSVITQSGFSPAWSPDGSQLAYAATHCPGCEPPLIDPPIAIFVADPSDKTTGILVETAYDPRWSPDGETIAFSQLTYAEGHDFPWEFAHVSTGGGEPAPVPGVPDQAALNGFAWSPDGSRLAFGGNDGVFVANSDGSDPQLVAANQASLTARNPRWSPDGRFILYDMVATQGDAVLDWVVGRDGSEPYPLGEAVGYGADWQPLLRPLP